MKIAFWSIGKAHEAYVKSGVEDFSRRINNYFKLEWEIIAPLKNAAKMTVPDIKKSEADIILAKIQKDDFLIALDERGIQLSSEALAQQIQQCANSSAK
ncbi:MAG TPA: 23S rRNA (pseudouridine(1915)-N(3))-methyltransferase RlmH, partial [Niabella sp.]|nr:23S rRNA (pseudouridine(1915)-N(3))-methyltransferase RlmH [Niabella sp.]